MRLKGDSATEFRYSMIVKLSKEGKNQIAIAQTTQCSQAWVSKVLARAEQEQQDTLFIKGKAKLRLSNAVPLFLSHKRHHALLMPVVRVINVVLSEGLGQRHRNTQSPSL